MFLVKKGFPRRASLFRLGLFILRFGTIIHCAVITLSSTNEIPYLPAYIVSAIAGFVLSYVLISFTNMGVWALVVGNGVAQLTYNNWKWPMYLSRKFSSHYFALIRAGLMQWSCALKK